VRTDSRGTGDTLGNRRSDDLNLPLGDAQMTTEEIIMSKRERDRVKLIRARRAHQKEEDRAFMIAQGIDIPNDFDIKEEDEGAEKLSEYSNTTGTYTDRSGWSRADSWLSPSLPPGTPPFEVRWKFKKEEDAKRLANAERKLAEAALRAEMGEGALEMEISNIRSEHASLQDSATDIANGSGKNSRSGSKNSSRRSSKKVEIEYDEEGNPIIPLSPRGQSTRRSSIASTASATTIISTSTESTVFSENEVVPRLLFRGQNSRPSSGYSSYSVTSHSTDGSFSSRSEYRTGSSSTRSSMTTHRMGTISDSSRPSTSTTDYTPSSYYSSRSSTGSSYTDGSYSSRSGSSRFSFGTPRGGEDPDEIEFYNKYGHTGHTRDTGRSSYSGYSHTSGSYSSRSGSTFTDFSSAPTTERSEETQASYATFGSHKPTIDGRNATGAKSSGHSSDYTHSAASASARSDYSESSVETTESEIKERKIRAAGGGYGKGSRKPDHRLIYKQMYGSSKGPPIPKGPGAAALGKLKDPSIASSSLSARMSARSVEDSAALIAQGAEKDAASKSQTSGAKSMLAASVASAESAAKEAATAMETSGATVATGSGTLDAKKKKLNPKELKKLAAEEAAAAAAAQALKDEEAEKAKAEALANKPKPIKRPPIHGTLAPLSPRQGAVRLKDKHGLGEDEIFTDPSPLYQAALEKASELALISSLSNPNSRPGTTKKKRKKET